jgi:hypothetical protein
MGTRRARWGTLSTSFAAASCGLATLLIAAPAGAQAGARRICTPSSEVTCGELRVGPGIAAPRVADNGADIGVIWTAGSPLRHTVQFARIDERARVIETIVPVAHATGDVAIAGATGGFLVAYRGDDGTYVVRIDRDGQVFSEPRKVAEVSDTLDLVHLTEIGGESGLTALVLATGINVRVMYFDASGLSLDAPPRGAVFYGVGRLTRVFVVPFAGRLVRGIVPTDGYRTEAQIADTVVATVSSSVAAYTNLREGQPFGGSSNRTGRIELHLGRQGGDLLTMTTEDGAYTDVFAPANDMLFENTGVVGGRRPRGRGLAGEANLRDRSYLPTSPSSGVEVGLFGDFDSASTLVVARVHVRSRAPRTPARPRR